MPALKLPLEIINVLSFVSLDRISLPNISYIFIANLELVFETTIVAVVFIGFGYTEILIIVATSSVPKLQSLLRLAGVPYSNPGAAQASQFSPSSLSKSGAINSSVGPFPSA